MTQFTDLGLAAPLLKALAAKNYSVPSPIQVQAIPPVLAGHDLIGLAQTGTGKTAAFALPILHRLSMNQDRALPRGACRALVLAPTRELAAQINESFGSYGRFLGLTSTVAFGGVPIGKQIKAITRGVDVLVATPGRLLDLIEQRACRLDLVEIVVLDEADHMLDLGFVVPIRKIVRMTPKQRQTLLFSATMPGPIAELASEFLNQPMQVAVTPVAATADRVTQSVIHVDAAKKQTLLIDILKNDKAITRALVFTRTKHGANRVAEKLEEAGIGAEAIHGNKSQGQRERALEAFKRGRARLLIATEIAARGIDVDAVTHVINFDLPDVPEQYVHRIGRTARAGAEGIAISFCAMDERGNLRDIERLTRQSVPVQEHALSLAPPQPGDRVTKRPQPQRGGQGQRSGQQRQGQRPQHAQDKRPGANASKPQARDGEARRGGEPKRERGGDAVWSNHPAPTRPAKRAQWRP